MEIVTVNKEKSVFIYDGVEYPPTRHNANCVRKYRETGDEVCLESLSTVVLDI